MHFVDGSLTVFTNKYQKSASGLLICTAKRLCNLARLLTWKFFPEVVSPSRRQSLKYFVLLHRFALLAGVVTAQTQVEVGPSKPRIGTNCLLMHFNRFRVAFEIDVCEPQISQGNDILWSKLNSFFVSLNPCCFSLQSRARTPEAY